MAIVSHGPIQDASPVDFKLHRYPDSGLCVIRPHCWRNIAIALTDQRSKRVIVC